MDKNSVKEILKEILKNDINIELKVDDSGYAYVEVRLDDEVIHESYHIDIQEEIEDAKNSLEARAWV